VRGDRFVVVYVRHQGVRADRAGGVVGGRLGRQPGAQVNELCDPTCGGVGGGAALKRPFGLGNLRYFGELAQDRVGCSRVVFAAEKVVVPGPVRPGGAERDQRRVLRGLSCLSTFLQVGGSAGAAPCAQPS
jgi:hypothetical protein